MSSSSSAVLIKRGAVTKLGKLVKHKMRTKRLNLVTNPRFTFWSINAGVPPHRSDRGRDNRVYKFEQIIDYATVLTSSNVGPVLGGQNFQLNTLPQVTTFTSLFDQYRITRIQAWLQVNQTNNGGHTGYFYSAVDYDQSGAPSSLGALQQYQNVKMANFQNGHYHDFVPHVAMAAYSGAFTSYANQGNQWLDSNSPTIQHYGLVFGVGATTDNGITFALNVRLHFEFRNVI